MAAENKKNDNEKTLKKGFEIFNFVKDIASKTGDILATGNSTVKLIKMGVDGSMTVLQSIPKSLLEGELVPIGLVKELGTWGASSAVGETIIVTAGGLASAGAATILGAATLTAAAGALYGALWQKVYEHSKENPIWEGAPEMKYDGMYLHDPSKSGNEIPNEDAIMKNYSLNDPGKPLKHALTALGLKPDEVHLAPAASNGNSTSEALAIRDKDTSEKIGSCVMTPGGCEMTAGDRKVVMDRISGSDIHLETYAKNDDGKYKLLGQTRIGDNDGITVRRPFTGLA